MSESPPLKHVPDVLARWLAGEDLPSPPRAAQALSELSERLATPVSSPSREFLIRTTQRPTRRWAAIAATGACLVVGIAGYAILQKTESGAFSQPRAYQTASGERATIMLPDGTAMMLNVATQVTVDKGFGVTNRTVRLEGEAQFTVTHDAALPFVVEANGTTVRDLATVFAVRAYRDGPHTRIAVREGSVSVQSSAMSSASAVTLVAQQFAVVALDGVPQVGQLSRSDGDFSWTRGELVLRQHPLGEAFAEMARWYGMTFQVADQQLLTYSVSARLPSQFNMQDIRDIADIIGARAERHGNVVTMYPASRPASGSTSSHQTK